MYIACRPQGACMLLHQLANCRVHTRGSPCQQLAAHRSAQLSRWRCMNSSALQSIVIAKRRLAPWSCRSSLCFRLRGMLCCASWACMTHRDRVLQEASKPQAEVSARVKTDREAICPKPFTFWAPPFRRAFSLISCLAGCNSQDALHLQAVKESSS